MDFYTVHVCQFSVAIADCKFRASVKTSKTHFTFFQFPDRISVYHLYCSNRTFFCTDTTTDTCIFIYRQIFCFSTCWFLYFLILTWWKILFIYILLYVIKYHSQYLLFFGLNTTDHTIIRYIFCYYRTCCDHNIIANGNTWKNCDIVICQKMISSITGTIHIFLFWKNLCFIICIQTSFYFTKLHKWFIILS